MGKKDVIVVSGPPSSGSTSVSKLLAEKLGYSYFVTGSVHKKLAKSDSESDSALEAWKSVKGSSGEFHRRLDELQVKEAKKGRVVICGKLAIHFLRNLSDYKIWLDVPLKVRAERAAERDKLKVSEAMKKVKERQEIERREWKKMYGFDYFCQKKMADLVLDSSELTLEETVERILEFLKR